MYLKSYQKKFLTHYFKHYLKHESISESLDLQYKQDDTQALIILSKQIKSFKTMSQTLRNLNKAEQYLNNKRIFDPVNYSIEQV